RVRYAPTKNSYLPGALVLNYGLKLAKSKYPLVVMVTPQFPEDGRETLRKQNISMIDIKSLNPKEGVHVLAAHDTRFADTWTKLR
ncbi:hypothetical protein B0H10DRAFT_2019392, partial [Mycena sp. CBHHK59/15]